MSRLVVVSNRLPTLRRSGSVEEAEAPVGGLASALLGVLRRSPGGLWFGWNGKILEAGRPARPSLRTAGDFDQVGVPLTRLELQNYYLGYCNQTLWPLLHCFQDRVRIRLRQELVYRQVQGHFAASLLPYLRQDDVVWVHDYHLMLLGRELRRMGWTGRIGFFLHTPFPPHDLWQILPAPRDTLEALLDYDVIGFHVQAFLDNYVSCCRRELQATLRGSTLTAGGRSQRADVYPVGIEPAAFLPRRAEKLGPQPPELLKGALRGRRLILGVDRLDYTKGIPEKILGFEKFIKRHSIWRRKAVLVQIASPSRTGVPEYAEQRRQIESLMGRVNGELGEHDWMPIRYLYRSYSRDFLARLYREASVGLVTPLRDGMNLVAKEFVAAQDVRSPGVLVLSRSAGAAQEMREAVTVNPFIPADVAEGIAKALSMPLERRREIHSALLERVMAGTATEWGRRFVEDLSGSGARAMAREPERLRRPRLSTPVPT
ncbi:MAG TPA: trehalose-6-phosphate synthase [Candidatus Polarisedimenticolia bacterium]|nr:trehalose-6-phosphate synthase [Candidatus Polarisedimenticolia bacterium]